MKDAWSAWMVWAYAQALSAYHAHYPGQHSAFRGCLLGEGVVVRCPSDLKKHSYRCIQDALGVDRAGRHCRMRTPDVGLPRSRWIGPFVRSSTLATSLRKGVSHAGVLLVMTPSSVPMTSRTSQAKVATPTGNLQLTAIGAAAGVYHHANAGTDKLLAGRYMHAERQCKAPEASWELLFVCHCDRAPHHVIICSLKTLAFRWCCWSTEEQFYV